MANKKPQFINPKKVIALEESSNYIILMGARSNGKSYVTKRNAVQCAIDSGGDEKFIYLRRYESDCKDSLCVQYFADLPIYEMTNGKFDCIDVYRKGIYLCNIDTETGKISNRFKIGYCHALSIAERYKSLMFPDVTRIIYEEFISSSGAYLGQREPDALQQYVSTIFRLRKGVVYLIGNTISRICPYFRKWQLTGLMKQKTGTVDTYRYKTKDSETIISLYLVSPIELNSGMYFGKESENIVNGAYETEEQNHLNESEKCYDELYRCVVKYEDFMFICKFLKHKQRKNEFTWYVIPKTKPEIKNNTRVISPEYNTSILWTNGFNALTQNESYIFSFIDEGKIAFSDDLTGTEFWNIYENYL